MDQEERVTDEVRTLIQQSPAALMQLVEGSSAHPVSSQSKLVMDPLHLIHEKPSGGGWRFKCFRADDITDRMISRVS